MAAKSSRVRIQNGLMGDITGTTFGDVLREIVANEKIDEYKGKILNIFSGDLNLPAGDTDLEIINNLPVGSIETNEKSIDTLHKILKRLQYLQQVSQSSIMEITEKFNKVSGEIIIFKMDRNNSIDDSIIGNEYLDELKKKAEDLMRQRENESTFSANLGELIPLVNNRILLIKSQLTQQYKMTFAERLRQARQAAGLRQQDLAERLERTQNGFAQFENAIREPDITTLARIAKILNVSLDWLCGIQN